MKIKDIINSLEELAPPAYQEHYDNSGLLIGDRDAQLKGITISLDVTEAVIQEAIANGDNLIVAHHPLIFKGLKSLTPTHWVQRCIIKAIKHDIAIYAIHTNLDNISSGVNRKFANKLKLNNQELLDPKDGVLRKLVTFIPIDSVETLMDSLYQAGVGQVGNYDHCSFQLNGTGTFRPNDAANPTIGESGKDEEVAEKRIEVIYPTYKEAHVIASLKEAHPYEEVAYYIHPILNQNQEVGSGMIGTLQPPLSQEDFLEYVKESIDLKTIRYTETNNRTIQKVAICGGAGSFLLNKAISKGADAFITGDFKYHDFFEGDGKILIADIGHYESEVATKELLFDYLRENFANIAVRLTEVNTNPIKYL